MATRFCKFSLNCNSAARRGKLTCSGHARHEFTAQMLVKAFADLQKRNAARRAGESV